MKKLKRFICKHFGHKWIFWMAGGSKDSEVFKCERCNTIGM